jgi:hypothetical protein
MLCQEDLHNLAEEAPLKQHFPEALRIVRQEIGQLIKLVKDEDPGGGIVDIAAGALDLARPFGQGVHAIARGQRECSLGHSLAR